MLKIGDFSHLSHVSVRMLRHYDQLGLLKPICVDRFTGYRYYSIEQLPRLNRILALKDLGVALEQIALLLADNQVLVDIHSLLHQKHSELQQQIRADQARLRRIETRLRLIEQEQTMSPYEVVIKEVPALTVASIREVVATKDAMPERCRRMSEEIGQWMQQTGTPGAGLWFAIYYNTGYTETDIDVEMTAPIGATTSAGGSKQQGRVTQRTLPPSSMACVVHPGSYDNILEAYSAIGKWIEANSFTITGPCREIYLQGPEQGEPVTEIQFPVERR
jgi:effector-binding domain-containing protein/DNA-binding transcriptional MerR regulator